MEPKDSKKIMEKPLWSIGFSITHIFIFCPFITFYFVFISFLLGFHTDYTEEIL